MVNHLSHRYVFMTDQFDSELAWASDFEATIIVLRGTELHGRAWASLLARLRRIKRPVLLHAHAGSGLNVTQRGQLADAIHHQAPVAVLAEDKGGRELGMALRWLGADATVFTPDQLLGAAAKLGLEAAHLSSSLRALGRAGLDLQAVDQKLQAYSSGVFGGL
ncbi:hypothetical protein G6O69_24975 [Pseudenhygromyxa sp. WMMC2535]|uniref:hypothetical protein n=1 Tax=Pseudenhygromyxa sp. WMMC2535 TaxID=2712867 RepID=UPI001551B44A|nr:hypothetical protein [Pseudenhygromyxa sp. WMMC2535]NVB41117.1 hypothetical protein [Pseudenhygromyxa sp. WMMC2535]